MLSRFNLAHQIAMSALVFCFLFATIEDLLVFLAAVASIVVSEVIVRAILRARRKITRLERENRWLEGENEQLEAANEALKAQYASLDGRYDDLLDELREDRTMRETFEVLAFHLWIQREMPQCDFSELDRHDRRTIARDWRLRAFDEVRGHPYSEIMTFFTEEDPTRGDLLPKNYDDKNWPPPPSSSS